MGDQATAPWASPALRVLVAIMAMLTLLVAACSNAGSASSAEDASDQVAIDEPALAVTPSFDEPEQPMPQSGIAGRNILVPGWDHPGELVITAPGGTDTYLVELKYTDSSGSVLRVFVSPGQTVSVDVPVDGTSARYDLFYAAGSRWYGDEYTFGPDGTYARADDVFEFVEGRQWQVELVLQPGGNLGTSGIDYADF